MSAGTYIDFSFWAEHCVFSIVIKFESLSHYSIYFCHLMVSFYIHECAFTKSGYFPWDRARSVPIMLCSKEQPGEVPRQWSWTSTCISNQLLHYSGVIVRFRTNCCPSENLSQMGQQNDSTALHLCVSCPKTRAAHEGEGWAGAPVGFEANCYTAPFVSKNELLQPILSVNTTFIIIVF